MTSIDKANVLQTSRLWREVASRVAKDYPDVAFSIEFVHSAAMHLVRRPADFDVIVTENLFGDILTDEASSSRRIDRNAAVSMTRRRQPRPVWSLSTARAPILTGRGVANPYGMILSAALLLRHSLGEEAAATSIERAVELAVNDGIVTADGGGTSRTSECGAAVIERLR